MYESDCDQTPGMVPVPHVKAVRIKFEKLLAQCVWVPLSRKQPCSWTPTSPHCRAPLPSPARDLSLLFSTCAGVCMVWFFRPIIQHRRLIVQLGSEPRQLRPQFQLHQSLYATWPGCLNSLNFSFLICKTGIIMPSSWAKDKMVIYTT